MDTSNLPLRPILTTVSSLMGVLALGGGIYGITNPQGSAETLGIPITTPNSPALPFASFVGARNLGSGITTLTLLAMGERKVVGAIFMCGVVTAMTDAWVCAKYGASEGKAAGHAFMGAVAGCLGGAMYWLRD